MFVIRLFCCAGMSTSLIVRRMEEEASRRGLACDIQAFTIDVAEQHLDAADVVLIGPQIRYRMNEVKALCDPLGIPYGVIPMAMYGLLDGKQIMDFALKTAGQA